MRKLKVVQIGVGHDHAFASVQCLNKMKDMFDYVGYVITENDGETFSRQSELYKNYKRLTIDEALGIKDLDGAFIETYDKDLVKYAKLFVDRGINVYMDKPGSENVIDFDELLKTVKEKNLVFEMGYMYRYNPAVEYAKKLVSSGKLGEIYSVEAHMDCDQYREKREWLSPFKGGMTFYLGCHLVDLIMQFQGLPDEIIPFNTKSRYQNVDSEDVGMAVFKYNNGVSFLKTSALEAGGFNRRQLVICGTLGTFVIEPLERFVGTCGSYIYTEATLYLRGDNDRLDWNDRGEKIVFEPFERYDGLFIDFYRMVVGEKKSDYSIEYESKLHRAILNACGIKCDYKKENI